MSVRLRRADSTDERFLRQMVSLAAGWRDGRHAVLTPAVAGYVEGFGRPGDHGIVALIAGHRVGAAWYRLFRAPSVAYGYVSDDVPELALAVVPHARRSGIASELLRRLLADAGEQGLAGVSLSVEPDNPARSLYERAGFVKVADRNGAWTMLKTLSPQPSVRRR